MAEAMLVMKLAGPFIAPIISKLAEKASPFFGGDATAEKLDNLRTVILPQIRLIIDSAGEADKVATLVPWLNKLKAAALEADDVLDELEYRRLADQVNPPAPLLRTMRKCREKVKELAAPVLPKTKLKKRVEELEKIASEAGRFVKLLGLHRDSQPSQNDDRSNRDTSVPSLPPIVVGREQERERWVRVLTPPADDDEEAKSGTQSWSAPIHAIWGIGGAGKTTLAQSVINDPRIVEQFGDMRIWVHLPRKLDVPQATRDLIEFITKGECPRMETLAALQAKLRELFEKSENKILLILDDLWVHDKPEDDRIQLEKLLQPLNEVGRAGSMVLITTRMEGAASMLGATNIVPIKELDYENCRSIILHYARRRVDELDADQERILNTMVSKLKNSPLAARLVGSRLCGVHDWSIIWKGDMLEGTKNALLWSFRSLPPHLKSCFAFCSLFPKGFSFWDVEHKPSWTDFEVDVLVRIWIAQGFVEEPTEAEEDLTIEEKGKQYFNELRFFSFFQPHPREEKGVYVIHDLLHDLAADVSQGHCFRIGDNMATNIPPTVIHLSIGVRQRRAFRISDLMKLVSLRTFLILDISDVDQEDFIRHGGEMIKKLSKLRLLHFGPFVPAYDFANSICRLKHLRYFHVDVYPNLPESFGTLYHLQDIRLGRHIDFIDAVPKSLGNLVKLRHIHPGEICSRIDDVGKLTSLQELEVHDTDRTKQFGLQQLQKMQQIRGRLTIEGLQFVKDKAGATIAMLKEKRHLEELKLKWDFNGATDVDPDTDEAVLEGLEPHPSLKKLTIWGYNGAKPPGWMLDDRRGWLLNLTSLELKQCPNLSAVPNLPCRLRELTVENCPRLMQLNPFPCSLEVLVVKNSPVTEALLSSVVTSYNKREQQQQQHLSSEASSSHQHFALRSLKICGDCVLEENTLNEFLMSNKFNSLSELRFGDLPSITSLLLGPHLTALENLSIVGLGNLRSIKGLGSLTSLKRLAVLKCPGLATTAGAGGGEMDNDNRLPSLKELQIDDHFLLLVLLQEHGLNSLVDLEISGCSPFSAEQEGIFLHLTSLRMLHFRNCDNLSAVPNLPCRLSKLVVKNCPKIESLPNLPSSLTLLWIHECPEIESLPNLPCSLDFLWILKCPKIESLPNLPSSLTSLEIYECSKIESLPNLPSSLTSLEIYECPKIESLPNLPSSLTRLFIRECHPRLKANYKRGGRLRHEIDHVHLIEIW